jgi:sporulation related protein
VVALAVILKRYSSAALALALPILACGRSDRGNAPASSTQAGAATVSNAGPQALVLRVPQRGGVPRVHAYPRVDSTIWTSTDSAPRPATILAFDHESGNVAYEDTRGRPVLLELRLGDVTVFSAKKLTGLASADGKSVYGIAANGDVVRMTPTGNWTYKPPQPATAVFPQPGGMLLVAVGKGANTRLFKLYPPEQRIRDSIPFPVATRVARTQLGDRVYLAVDSGLAVLRTRTMDWAPSIPFEEPIAFMASTPSGDRVFVLTESRREIAVVDRFRDRVTARIQLPGKAGDLRVDPFGRYLLARAAEGDSIWIAAIGTQRMIGGFTGTWREDLPFVGYDGGVAVADGADVVILDGETLKPRSRVRGAAQDYWYPFLWDGFRPRSAALDEPVRFDSIAIDTTAFDTTAFARGDSSRAFPSDTAGPIRGFYISFAALLSEERAREVASKININGEHPRVVTTNREGSTIYRVVIGPYLTREEADRVGRETGQSYWVYEGVP